MRVGELRRRGDRRHRAARRHRWRIAEVQRPRRLAGPVRVPRVLALAGHIWTRAPRVIRRGSEPAGVADGAEPAGVANSVKPAGVADGAEPSRVGACPEPAGIAACPELIRIAARVELVAAAAQGKPSGIPGAPELARVARTARRVELVAGNFSGCLCAGGGRQRSPRRPRTPRLGTLGVPSPAIVAPRPVTHPFLPVQPLGTGQGVQPGCPWFARRSYLSAAPLKEETAADN